MTGTGISHANYFKSYRKYLGFSSKECAKNYFGAKDISPKIDHDYIHNLLNRVNDIIKNINSIVKYYDSSIFNTFLEESVYKPYTIINEAGFLSKLNNQGRRPEEVLFSWVRGYATCEYFKPIIANIFNINFSTIEMIGKDDINNPKVFQRSPVADFKFNRNDCTIRVEFQSGFQNVNDIKEHKVREAKRVYYETGEFTVCVHIDLFNGQTAFVRLDTVEDNDVNFVTRQQMEGQSVFAIDQNYFKWRLLDPVPSLEELDLDLP